jgi:hypothetical protein
MSYSENRLVPKQVIERMERMKLGAWTKQELEESLYALEVCNANHKWDEQINLLEAELSKRRTQMLIFCS